MKFIKNISAANKNDNKTTTKELSSHIKKLKPNINAELIKIEIIIVDKTINLK